MSTTDSSAQVPLINEPMKSVPIVGNKSFGAKELKSRPWGIAIAVFTTLIICLNIANIPFCAVYIYFFSVAQYYDLLAIYSVSLVLSSGFVIVSICGLCSVTNLSKPDVRALRFSFYYLVGLVFFMIAALAVKIAETVITVTRYDTATAAPGGYSPKIVGLAAGITGAVVVLPCWGLLIMCVACRYSHLKKEVKQNYKYTPAI
jgi:signal transduction histidine kinase